ncbi:MAG TPA: DUF885 domain-containing protein [Polyangia bacterium]|nr:DUF885 domain-containing protein [Polyangia bacterium]
MPAPGTPRLRAARLLPLLLAALATADCAPACPLPAECRVAQVAPHDRLSRLAQTYWDERLAADPLEATELGDRRFDDELPDESPAGLARRRQALGRLAASVASIERETLDAGDRVTGALLAGQIDADLAQLSCGLEEWAVDAREGPQVVYLRLAELQPVRGVAEGRALAARWGKIGGAIDQETANLRRGLAAGKVTTKAEVSRVLGQLDELLARPDAEWPLRAPAAAPHPDWAPADRAELATAVDTAIARGIRPAFTRYRDFLAREVQPRARDDAHAGISNVPGGAACYAKLIKVHTSLDLSAREIHELGLRELARVQAEMRALGEQALGTDALPEIRRRLLDDRSLRFATRDEIEATARATLARAHAAEPRFLGHPPERPCVVKRIDPFEEKDSPMAYYRPAAADGSRPGAYCVDTYEPEKHPRFEFEALTFHESVPGHHIQIALAQELHGLPEFRKHLGVTAFVEGWGLYAEGLADELGLYSGPLDRLGRLSFSAWRAIRLVVDTGVHALGWSRERAIAFMEENALLSRENVVNEVDRYIAWPGQALAYKLGELEIRRARADAEQRLGPRFDLRAFHDALLGQGAVSLPVLRLQIDAWVRRTLNEPPRAAD